MRTRANRHVISYAYEWLVIGVLAPHVVQYGGLPPLAYRQTISIHIKNDVSQSNLRRIAHATPGMAPNIIHTQRYAAWYSLFVAPKLLV